MLRRSAIGDMSLGCGTLAGPSGFKPIGTSAAASGKDGVGKQHSLPTSPAHSLITYEHIENHWDAKQSKSPTRLWGTTKGTRWKGEERQDGAEHWLQGEFWNRDSNIKKWSEHEVRRNAASANHDTHRHDQITRTVLAPQPSKNGSAERLPRMCLSGVVSPDSCFLEAWGFDLGNRDRQGNICSTFKPCSKSEHFRAERSFNRNVERISDNFRTMRKTASSPSVSQVQAQTLRPEDIGGDAGEMSHVDDSSTMTAGRTHASRSCRYWDSWDHAARREATKMSCGVHSQAFRQHKDDHPHKDNLELSPAAIYTRKFREMGGEDSLRKSTRKYRGSGEKLA